MGAGLSGIGAACHLQTESPSTSYQILEARDRSGGTWDLFTYPGIRSDSDMFTLGYGFRPWTGTKPIAEGADILSYLRETATGVRRRSAHRLPLQGHRSRLVHCRCPLDCDGGAHRLGQAHQADLRLPVPVLGVLPLRRGLHPGMAGLADFGGTVIHPQHWPDQAEVEGKRVVVVGSGATAVTLVPALAEAGARVTMLQRSPSYVMSLPGQDPLAGALRRMLPERKAYTAIRWKNVKIATALYSLCQRFPTKARAALTKGAAKQLPAGYDVDTHFNPTYQPWDQRLCLVPDGDFFAAISSGRAEVVTDQIDHFTSTGLKLTSGPARRRHRRHRKPV